MLELNQKLLELYKYIKICLIYHHAKELRQKNTLKDAQHDLFLYLYDRGKRELNPQTKRYIYILSLYYPIYIRKYKYSSKAEQVLLDLEGNPVEVGVSYFPNGDVLYDLNLIEQNTPKEVLTAKASNARPVIATYLDDTCEVFDSIELFAKKIGCRRSTANVWLRFGIPKKRRMLDHIHAIKNIEYLV